jgi:hypothetical protein
MATPNYRVVLDQSAWDRLHDPRADYHAFIQTVEADPKIRADPRTRTIEIDYSYGDLNNIYRNFRGLIGGNRTSWAEDYGTDEFHREAEERLEESRDLFRDTDYPAIDPNSKFHLPDGCPAEDGVQHILMDAPGVCLGHSHTQASAYQFLADVMENPEAFVVEGGMLFIEEIPATFQDEIDNYLTADPEPAWSQATQAFFDQIARDRGLKGPTRLESILQKARQKNIRIFSIDSGELSPVNSAQASFGEMRTANMNAFAKEVMDRAIANNPDRKFVVFCGSAHSNTHEGGIPGLAQLYNIPAVKLNDDGTVVKDNEDRSLRRMPPKEVQVFVDQYLLEAEKAGVIGTEVPRDQAKAYAEQLAERLQAAGKLPDFSGVAGAGDAQAQKRAKEALKQQIRNLATSIPKSAEKRYQDAKGKIEAGDPDAVRDLLVIDPELALRRDGNGRNLLDTAMTLGAKDTATVLREAMVAQVQAKGTQGAPISDLDLAEAIVIEAERKAWEGQDGQGGNEGVDVNQKKHRTVVTELAGRLSRLRPDQKANPAQLVAQMSTALANDPQAGFYKKGRKLIGRRDPDHVSIDKKKAARIWVAELARL